MREMPDIPADIAHFFELTGVLQSLPPLSLTLRQHALAGVAARMQWLKRRTGQFSFSDMIERLTARCTASTARCCASASWPSTRRP